MLDRFLHENSSGMRLARTIVQGVIGVLIANIDVVFGLVSIDPTMKPVITATVMAVLSPIMAEIRKSDE